MPILWPLKVPERGNAITQRKTFWKLNTRLTRLLQSFMFHASASFKVRRTSIKIFAKDKLIVLKGSRID